MTYCRKKHEELCFLLPTIWVERDNSTFHDDWILGISWFMWTFEVCYEA